jgi:hypothetical protein
MSEKGCIWTSTDFKSCDKVYQTYFRYNANYDFTLNNKALGEKMLLLSSSNHDEVASEEEQDQTTWSSAPLNNFIVSFLVRHDKNRLKLYNEVLSYFARFGLKNNCSLNENSECFTSSQWQHLFNTLLTDYVYFKYAISSVYRDGAYLGSVLKYKDLELGYEEVNIVLKFQAETIKEAKTLIGSIRSILYDSLVLLWFPNTSLSININNTNNKTKLQIKELALVNTINKHFSDYIGSQVTQSMKNLFDAVHPDKAISMISHTKYMIPLDTVRSYFLKIK